MSGRLSIGIAHSISEAPCPSCACKAIVAGALCAVAATWFVLPIRTEAVIRSRLADAPSAPDDGVAHVSECERAALLAALYAVRRAVAKHGSRTATDAEAPYTALKTLRETLATTDEASRRTCSG